MHFKQHFVSSENHIALFYRLFINDVTQQTKNGQ